MMSATIRRILIPALLLLPLASCGSAIAQVRPAAAALNFGGDQVLIGSQAGLQVFTWPEMALLRTVDCRLEMILDLCLSTDGQRVLVAGGSSGERGELQIVNPADGSNGLFCAPHSDRITQARWLPGEQQILTTSDDGSAALLNATTGEVLRRITLHSRPLLALEIFSNDQAASAGMDGIIRLWRPADGQLLRTLDNHTAPVTDLLYSAASPPHTTPAVLYSASRDRTIRLWQPDRGRMVRFTRLNSIPEKLALTPNHQQLLAGCSDGSLHVLHATTLQLLQTHPAGSDSLGYFRKMLALTRE
jgi:WD40 repeat protein